MGNYLGWLGNLGWLGILGVLFGPLFWLFFLFFLFGLSFIPSKSDVKRGNRLLFLGLLGFVGFLTGTFWYETWALSSLFTLFILGILPRKLKG